MIFHLSSAGVPITWTISSISKSAYGISHAAASLWAEKSSTPQFVCEIEAAGDTLRVKRQDLWMSDDYLQRQEPDDPSYLVQFATSPLPLPEAYQTALSEALRRALMDKGYLIPRDQWERRYPSQVLVAQRFKDFHAACDAHGDDLVFDLRWIMFMQPPKGFVFPYGVHEGRDGGWCVTQRSPSGGLALVKGVVAASEEEAKDFARLLNSGWSLDEVHVLLRAEPIEEVSPLLAP